MVLLLHLPTSRARPRPTTETPAQTPLPAPPSTLPRDQAPCHNISSRRIRGARQHLPASIRTSPGQAAFANSRSGARTARDSTPPRGRRPGSATDAGTPRHTRQLLGEAAGACEPADPDAPPPGPARAPGGGSARSAPSAAPRRRAGPGSRWSPGCCGTPRRRAAALLGLGEHLHHLEGGARGGPRARRASSCARAGRGSCRSGSASAQSPFGCGAPCGSRPRSSETPAFPQRLVPDPGEHLGQAGPGGLERPRGAQHLLAERVAARRSPTTFRHRRAPGISPLPDRW